MKINPTQHIRQMVARLKGLHQKYPGIVNAVGDVQGTAGFRAAAERCGCTYATVLRVENDLWQVQFLIGRSKAATAAFVRGRRE